MQDTTVNGVQVDLVSAETATDDTMDEDDSLSGGAIAGIVIGSVAAALLVLIAAVLVLRSDGVEKA